MNKVVWISLGYRQMGELWVKPIAYSVLVYCPDKEQISLCFRDMSKKIAIWATRVVTDKTPEEICSIEFDVCNSVPVAGPRIPFDLLASADIIGALLGD